MKKLGTRKFILLGFVVFISIVLLIMGANGDKKTYEKTGKVEYKMTGNENFTGSVNITYFDEDGYNIMFRLNKYNDYFQIVEVPEGKYKLGNIEVNKGYVVKTFDEIEVRENKLLTVDIAVIEEKLVKSLSDNKKLKKTKDKNLKVNKDNQQSFNCKECLIFILNYKSKTIVH